jgi:biopolymer transport protein ExbB
MLNIILQTGITSSVASALDSASKVGPDVTAAVTGIPQPTEESFQLFDMVQKGGYIMYPLGILLLVTIYFFVERLIVILRANKKDKNLLNTIKENLHNGNVDAAKAACKSSSSVESVMLERGISRIGKPISDLKAEMDDVGMEEISKLEKNLNTLSIIGKIGPMFGFIGTILGVIKIFYDISKTNTVQIDVISNGLYQKMISSAGGLIVGVLAFVLFHFLNSRIDRISLRMESARNKFLDIIQ